MELTFPYQLLCIVTLDWLAVAMCICIKTQSWRSCSTRSGWFRHRNYDIVSPCVMRCWVSHTSCSQQTCFTDRKVLVLDDTEMIDFTIARCTVIQGYDQDRGQRYSVCWDRSKRKKSPGHWIQWKNDSFCWVYTLKTNNRSHSHSEMSSGMLHSLVLLMWCIKLNCCCNNSRLCGCHISTQAFNTLKHITNSNSDNLLINMYF